MKFDSSTTCAFQVADEVRTRGESWPSHLKEYFKKLHSSEHPYWNSYFFSEIRPGKIRPMKPPKGELRKRRWYQRRVSFFVGSCVAIAFVEGYRDHYMMWRVRRIKYRGAGLDRRRWRVIEFPNAAYGNYPVPRNRYR